MKALRTIAAAVVFCACALLGSSRCLAGEPMVPHEALYSAGPSIASINGDDGYSVNLDLAYTFDLKYTFDLIFLSTSLNLKYMRFEGNDYFGPQLEVSTYYLFSIGGGIGALWGDERTMIRHLFIGLPIPLGVFVSHQPYRHDVSEHVYFEPYYRLNFVSGERLHEFGMYVKIGTYRIQ